MKYLFYLMWKKGSYFKKPKRIPSSLKTIDRKQEHPVSPKMLKERKMSFEIGSVRTYVRRHVCCYHKTTKIFDGIPTSYIVRWDLDASCFFSAPFLFLSPPLQFTQYTTHEHYALRLLK